MIQRIRNVAVLTAALAFMGVAPVAGQAGVSLALGTPGPTAELEDLEGNAVDLLDAEVVLFEVQIAAERTRTDLSIAEARLERLLAAPLSIFEESRAHVP